MESEQLEGYDKYTEADEGVLDTLAVIMNLYNRESRGHVERIRRYSKLLLDAVAERYPEYELNDERIHKIICAMAVQDIGEIAIPDHIILKPGRLDEYELEIMKQHTIKGCEIVESMADYITDQELYQYCYDICRSHHERYDGNGYPDGLVGEKIPLVAQVVSLVEMYDMLTTPHVYIREHSHYEAVQMILRGECGAFSPKLLSCFQQIEDELEKCGTSE